MRCIEARLMGEAELAAIGRVQLFFSAEFGHVQLRTKLVRTKLRNVPEPRRWAQYIDFLIYRLVTSLPGKRHRL